MNFTKENHFQMNTNRIAFPIHTFGQHLSIRRSLPSTHFQQVFPSIHFQRERFQVNSIGRPILRTNNHGYSTKR